MTSTTRNILIGLALGVATGLFLGEKADLFQFAAEGYLRLLQMTVLPYVMVSLRVAVPNLPYFEEIVHREFPRVEIVPVSVDRVTDFFAGRSERLDGLVFPAERGSYFTLLYPSFAVAVPHPLAIRFPLAYPVARRDLEFARFLGIWIDLQRKNGTIQALYDHWILGRDARPKQPHWSVIRNVLHWVS